MLRRRTLLQATTGAALAAPALAQSNRKISFLTWNLVDQEALIQRWIASFKAANPGAEVEWLDKKGPELPAFYQTQLAAGTPQLLLPYDNANAFVRGLSTHRGAFATWTAWVAPKTLKPAEAARSVGMSEDQLREVNKIPPRMLVRAGSTLLVPRSAHATNDVTEHLADNAAILLAPESSPARKRTVKAGPKGESVAALARRYRVDPAQLANWNGVAPGASFKAGQPVVLMVPGTKSRAVAKSSPSKRQAKPAPASRTRVAQQ